MKGKVEAVQTKIDLNSMRYEVNFVVTLKKGLSHDRSEELLAEIKSEYLGKMVEIAPSESEQIISTN